MNNFFSKILLIGVLTAIALTIIQKTPSAKSQTGNDFILVWSSDSYVPPDYPGKALAARNSQIKVVALPNGALTGNFDKLYFRWLLDDEPIGYAKGQGKSSFSFLTQKMPGDTQTVLAQILNEKENVIAQSALTIQISNPEILLFQEPGGYALQNNLETATNKNINLSAVPLFFHIQTPDELNFNWQFDNQTLTNPDQANLKSVTLKIPKASLSEPVVKQLNLSATNKKDQLQQANKRVEIIIK